MKKLPVLLAFLIALGLVSGVPAAFAEYEIDTSPQKLSTSVATDGSVVKWTNDVLVSWEKPAMAGGDVLNGFVYKWNTSSTALDDTALSGTVNDGSVHPNIDPPSLTKVAADFASDDSNLIRYLHIKTWFLDISANQASYSNDVVIGPINIDNVAPTGSVRITDANGSDISTTYNASLNLRLAASVNPSKMYVSETNQRPTTGATFAGETVHSLNETTPGDKTIYCWFEDTVGNISSAPVTDMVTLLSTVAISPYEPTLDLATTTTQVFKVDGTTANYNWEITDETPATPSDDVASFSGSASGVNSVTVSLTKPGTFKLRATPTAGGSALTSGTITVQQSFIKGDVNNSGTITPSDASAAFLLYLQKEWAEMTVQERFTGDFNDSGSVTPADASAIFQYYLSN